MNTTSTTGAHAEQTGEATLGGGSATAPGGSGLAVSEKLRRRMTTPFMMQLFMLRKLPLGLFAGLRLDRLEGDLCVTSVPYRWRTTNPFRSTYFAALAMAAELSTGALALLAARSAPASVSMLIVDLEASFGKKATSRATFTCRQGDKLRAAVAETVATGAPATATVETIGLLEDGSEAARFAYTWSFKRRSSAVRTAAESA